MDGEDNLDNINGDDEDNLDDINGDGDYHHNLMGGGSTLLEGLVCLVDQVLQFLGFQRL